MKWSDAHNLDPEGNERASRAVWRRLPAPGRRALQLVLGLAAMLVAGRSAFAVEVVLVDRTANTTIAMADNPADKTGNTVVVAWDNAPGDQPAGAMMFRREQRRDRTTYVAIGSGPILIVDRGGRTLVSGTVVPLFEVAFARDWDHEVPMVVSQDRKPDAATLLERYRAYEHIAGDGEGKAKIETAIRARLAQTNTTCNGSLRTDVAWTEFERAGQIALAKQTVGLLEAMAIRCADRDYKVAIGKLRTLRIGYRAEGALDLAARGPDLAASISPSSFNPRETTVRWIKDNL